MMSIDECRTLIDDGVSETLSDEDVLIIKDELQSLAEIFIDTVIDNPDSREYQRTLDK